MQFGGIGKAGIVLFATGEDAGAGGGVDIGVDADGDPNVAIVRTGIFAAPPAEPFPALVSIRPCDTVAFVLSSWFKVTVVLSARQQPKKYITKK
jgi:hypothetical protein